MKVFLLDLWLDLRAKRLAPLAVLLLGAIVAVPVVLAKSNDEAPAPAPAPTASAASATAPVIESQAQDQATSSKLQTFDPRDPFKPTHAAAATSTSPSSSSSSTSSSSSSTSSGSSSTSSGSSSSSGTSGSSTSSGVVSTGGGVATSTQPSTGTPNLRGLTKGSGQSNGTGTTTGETKTTLFTYTIDIRYGQAGSVKAYKDVKRLDLIPDADHAKIVFLGVTTTGKTAVFLVDGNTGVDTGGRCRPSGDKCTFLYLRADSDHDQAVLTDSDGSVYHLRLLGVHRVTVSSVTGKTGSTGTSNGSTGPKRSPAFAGRADSNTPAGEPDHRSAFQQFFADSATQ
jgi:hypothetical protein